MLKWSHIQNISIPYQEGFFEPAILGDFRVQLIPERARVGYVHTLSRAGIFRNMGFDAAVDAFKHMECLKIIDHFCGKSALYNKSLELLGAHPKRTGYYIYDGKDLRIESERIDLDGHVAEESTQTATRKRGVVHLAPEVSKELPRQTAREGDLATTRRVRGSSAAQAASYCVEIGKGTSIRMRNVIECVEKLDGCIQRASEDIQRTDDFLLEKMRENKKARSERMMDILKSNPCYDELLAIFCKLQRLQSAGYQRIAREHS